MSKQIGRIDIKIINNESDIDFIPKILEILDKKTPTTNLKPTPVIKVKTI